MTNTTYKGMVVLLVLIVIAVLAYGELTREDKRSMTDKVGDAIHALPDGMDKAERQLEDRTPGQKLGDAVKDTGDKIKDNTNPSPHE